MKSKLTTVRAAIFSTIFATVLGVMVFVPVWFVCGVISRMITNRIHPLSFVVAGIAAAAFFVFVFRIAFDYFRRGSKRNLLRMSSF